MSTRDTLGEQKIVTFTLGGQMFGIHMSALVEIREWEAPTPLPGVPAYIKGVTNLRGNVVPVVGLAERLGWNPSAIHARSCILVVNIAGKHAGFLVDEVNDIVTIADSAIQPPPDVETGEQGMILGLVGIEARGGDSAERKSVMVSLLDLEALRLSRAVVDLAA
ncbi:chemotaxis protein CheW [soil metagenome]